MTVINLMNRIRTALRLVGLVLLVSLFSRDLALSEHGPGEKPGLAPELADYAPAVQVSGSLHIAGSETMQPLLNRLVTEFRRHHPYAVISVQGGGSTTALKEFLENHAESKRTAKDRDEQPVQLAASSRALTPAEVERFVARTGYEPLAIPVAVDAVGIYVHRDNPLPGLTLEQVDAVFSTTRYRGYPHEIKRWGQLGLENGWTDAPIKLYGRNRKSGTRAFIQEHVLQNGEFSPAVHEEPGAASVILALSRDLYGIGYSGVGLQSSMVRAVPLAEKQGMPFIAPGVASVTDGSYPLRRTLYLYANRSPRTPLPPVAQEFLAFVNSREGQEAVIKAGFYPLPLRQVDQSLALLNLRGEATFRR